MNLRSPRTAIRRTSRLLHVPHIPMLKEANPRSGYITGWRVSEVLKLEWRQIDMKADEVRLDPGTTKNREGRVFPFTTELSCQDIVKV